MWAGAGWLPHTGGTVAPTLQGEWRAGGILIQRLYKSSGELLSDWTLSPGWPLHPSYFIFSIIKMCPSLVRAEFTKSPGSVQLAPILSVVRLGTVIRWSERMNLTKGEVPKEEGQYRGLHRYLGDFSVVELTASVCLPPLCQVPLALVFCSPSTRLGFSPFLFAHVTLI